MVIRHARREDSGVLAELILAASKTVRESDFSDEGWQLLEQTNTVEAFEDRFSLESYFALIYEIDGVVAGYMAVVEYEKIDHMFVLPGYRGLGICRKLWQQTQIICEESGYGYYYWVRSSTAAEPVYEAFGFRPCGERQSRNGISSRLMQLGEKKEV